MPRIKRPADADPPAALPVRRRISHKSDPTQLENAFRIFFPSGGQVLEGDDAAPSTPAPPSPTSESAFLDDFMDQPAVAHDRESSSSEPDCCDFSDDVMLGIAETFLASLDLEQNTILRRNWMQFAFCAAKPQREAFRYGVWVHGQRHGCILSTEAGRMLEHHLCRVDFAGDTVYPF